MQLPQELQKFGQETLIITADSATAKFFLAGGDSLEQIAALEVPRENKQDNEGSFVSSDGSRVAGPVEEKDAPRLNSFVRQVAEQADELVRKHGVSHLDLVMPAEVMHVLANELSSDSKPLVRRKLEKNLMFEQPVEIIKHLLAS